MKKLGRIPDGGGHRVLGHDTGRPVRGRGFDYVRSAVDDHSHLTHSEIHPDEKVATCTGFLTRAAAFYRAHGIDRIERVLTDNAWAYRKGLAWKAVLADLGAAGKLTRAYRPQTNGKVERFNRALLDEWWSSSAGNSRSSAPSCPSSPHGSRLRLQTRFLSRGRWLVTCRLGKRVPLDHVAGVCLS